MPQPPLSEDRMREVLEAVALHGTVRRAALALGIPEATARNRYNRAQQVLGEQIMRVQSHPQRMHVALDNADVLVFSDAHYWPGPASTAHKALLGAIKEFRPRLVICNGDAFDGATISRHPRIGWERRPTVKEELAAVEERLAEIEEAAASAKLVWNRGNHCSRFDSFLAAQAAQTEGVAGMSLAERFPRWMHATRTDINAGEDSHTLVTHRMAGGIHATRNNLLKAGVNVVTGHLHSLKVAPFTDARGTRYGVDTGTLAELPGEQFEGYLESGVTDWRSGFALLHYRQGRMLPPELIQVAALGVVEFRGQLHRVA